jgi:hypothetical protein
MEFEKIACRRAKRRGSSESPRSAFSLATAVSGASRKCRIGTLSAGETLKAVPEEDPALLSFGSSAKGFGGRGSVGVLKKVDINTP